MRRVEIPQPHGSARAAWLRRFDTSPNWRSLSAARDFGHAKKLLLGCWLGWLWNLKGVDTHAPLAQDPGK